VSDVQEFDDSEVLSFVNQFSSGGGVATAAPDEEEYDDPGDEDDDPTAEAEAAGLDVSYVQDGDTITLVISGAFEGDIRAVERGSDTVYVSTHFGGEHKSLKKALDAVARNTASRAVASEWERKNPKQDRAPRQRSTSSAKVDQLADQLGQMQAMMAQLLQAQGGAAAPATKPNPARIARS
jgi:hypothetical protein